MLTFSEMPTPFVEALLTRPLAERETPRFNAPPERRPRLRFLLLTTLLLALLLT